MLDVPESSPKVALKASYTQPSANKSHFIFQPPVDGSPTLHTRILPLMANMYSMVATQMIVAKREGGGAFTHQLCTGQEGVVASPFCP